MFRVAAALLALVELDGEVDVDRRAPGALEDFADSFLAGIAREMLDAVAAFALLQFSRSAAMTRPTVRGISSDKDGSLCGEEDGVMMDRLMD